METPKDLSPNSETKKFVAYILAPQHNSPQMLLSSNALANQERKINQYIASNSNQSLIKTFIELGDNRRSRHQWPELEKAIQYCVEHKMHLIIGEIRNLTANDDFADLIQSMLKHNSLPEHGFKHELICCDQPFIKEDNFKALVEHSKQQKKIHGELIKAGLNRTSARSGNPNASSVIHNVNHSKIDKAILFALLMQPIISEYRTKGYSQRKMVTLLNESGFHAPEGGDWVLSQFQKVLERIKFNESALTLEKQIMEYKKLNLSDADMVNKFKQLGIPSPKGKDWDEKVLAKVKERIKQLHEIIEFNNFIIAVSPLVSEYHIDELTEDILAHELQANGLELPQAPLN